jgi:hypothetical protein
LLPTIWAVSGDAALLRELHDRPLRGRVHSVFTRAVNIETAYGELFTIAARDVDNAPNTLIVDAAQFAPSKLEAGAFVASAAGELTIAPSFAIQLDTAIEWHATLTPYPADASTLPANLAQLERQLADAASSHGQHPSALAATTASLLERRAAALCAALCRADMQSATAQGKAMLGLGPGLTPSGDDFLVGLFAVLHIPRSPAESLKEVCAGIVEDLEHRTNAVSAAALKAAARGRVRESIAALLTAVTTGRCESVTTASRAVLAIGSTSGRDIVTGIVAGLAVNLQVGASTCNNRPSFLAA